MARQASTKKRWEIVSLSRIQRWLHMLQPRRFAQIQFIGLLFCLVSIGPTIIGASSAGSIALLADAIGLALDTSFELAIFFALRALRRQNAAIFPYGTGRLETLISAVIGLSLLISSLMLLVVSVMRLEAPVQPSGIGLGVLMVSASLVICLLLWFWAGRCSDADSMVVQQWRRLVLYDIVLNVVVIGSVVVAARLGGSFLWFDAAAGLLVSCFMLFHALRILRSSVWELSDRALEEEIQLSILRGLVLKFDDFDDLIDVRSRRLAGHPHIDVILGFNAGRRWDDIVLRCATVRDSIESQVRGARVKVLPASAELWRRGGAKDAPASAAHPPPPDTTMMVTRVPHLT